jgi:hypothetical protein
MRYTVEEEGTSWVLAIHLDYLARSPDEVVRMISGKRGAVDNIYHVQRPPKEDPSFA